MKFYLGIFLTQGKHDLIWKMSVPSAIPDKNCVTPASIRAVICSVRTVFNATHRLSVSLYRHGSLLGRWPVKAQTLFIIPIVTVLVVLNILVQIFQVLGFVTLNLLQNSGDSAAALRFLVFCQCVSFIEMSAFTWGNNIVDNVIEQVVQQGLRCVKLLRTCCAGFIHHDPDIADLLGVDYNKVVLPINVILKGFENGVQLLFCAIIIGHKISSFLVVIYFPS